MDKQIKIAAIHDMSGFGRCALTVVIPVISAMGMQCVPVPTAVLSTHTGGFEDFVWRDMSDYISPCCKHYKALGIEFDAIYSGFLASEGQVDSCLRFFDSFGSALRIVDPVMGDNGERYKTYTDELIARMQELVRKADIITPNLTEAAMLLGEDYPESLDEDTARRWLERLCGMSVSAVIKGIPLDNGMYANISLDGKTGEYNKLEWKKLPYFYPGTGDLFASVLTGFVLQGYSLSAAVESATKFSELAIRITAKTGNPCRDGVEFERILGLLMGNNGDLCL
ncbi:MAG: pyridoxamine kinase [Ruminiclostridium sp.]